MSNDTNMNELDQVRFVYTESAPNPTGLGFARTEEPTTASQLLDKALSFTTPSTDDYAGHKYGQNGELLNADSLVARKFKLTEEGQQKLDNYRALLDSASLLQLEGEVNTIEARKAFTRDSTDLSREEKLAESAMLRSLEGIVTTRMRDKVNMLMDKYSKDYAPDTYKSFITEIQAHNQIGKTKEQKAALRPISEVYNQALDFLIENHAETKYAKVLHQKQIKEAEVRKQDGLARARAALNRPGTRGAFLKTAGAFGAFVGLGMMHEQIGQILSPLALLNPEAPTDDASKPTSVPEWNDPAPMVDPVVGRLGSKPLNDKMLNAGASETVVKSEFVGNTEVKFGKIKLIQNYGEVHSPDIQINTVKSRFEWFRGISAKLRTRLLRNDSIEKDITESSPLKDGEFVAEVQDPNTKAQIEKTVSYSTSDGLGYSSIIPEITANKYVDAIINIHSRGVLINGKKTALPGEYFRGKFDGLGDEKSVRTRKQIDEICDKASGTIVDVVQPITGAIEQAMIIIERIPTHHADTYYNVSSSTVRELLEVTRVERNVAGILEAQKSGKEYTPIPERLPPSCQDNEVWFKFCGNAAVDEDFSFEGRNPDPKIAKMEQAFYIMQVIRLSPAERDELVAVQTSLQEGQYIDRASLESFRNKIYARSVNNSAA
jgi:hypothetical protein